MLEMTRIQVLRNQADMTKTLKLRVWNIYIYIGDEEECVLTQLNK